MKKILSILGTITLIGTSTGSLIACDKIHEYTPEKLKELKEENKIKTNNQEIRNNLEWIAPQEKSFNQIDDKWYFVVWRGNSNVDWKIINFNNNEEIKRWHPKTLDEQNNIKLCLNNYSWIPVDIDLSIDASTINRWKNDMSNYFKSVYRWNKDIDIPSLIVDKKTGKVKVEGE